jgi:O-acetyl-ADP-ribose deacetylase (regulator of RNase III)
VATGAGRLPARFVFHSVGPIYRGGERGEPDLLASCYRTCLKLAEDRGLSSLSFPAISTGVYGYPIRPAAEIAVREVKAHLEKADASLQRVVFVLFSRSDYKVYARLLERLPSIHAE